MGQVQEQRYACKLCSKTCPSGRSLGGHMRSHQAAIGASSGAAKAEIETGPEGGGHEQDDVGYQLEDQSNSAFSDADSGEADDDPNISYGLRENPKKSWRISISDPNCGFDTAKSGYRCKECDKEFPTSRALSGHMRAHSIKNRKETHQCKKCGKEFESIRAMFGHMKSHPKKRSSSPGDGGDDEDDESFSVLENICPVRKKRSTIRYNIATTNPSSSCLNEYNKCGAVFEVEDVEEVAKILIMLSKGVSIESSADFVCSVDKDKGVCGFDNLGSSFVAKSETKSSCANELDKDFLVPNAANEEPGSENEANLRIVKGFEKKGELKCKIKDHECHVCLKVFPSGQALGGHKRAHYNSTELGVSAAERLNQEVMTIMSGQAVVTQELGPEVDDQVMFDLNFPVSVDGEVKRDAGLSSLCAEMGRELLTS